MHGGSADPLGDVQDFSTSAKGLSGSVNTRHNHIQQQRIQVSVMVVGLHKKV